MVHHVTVGALVSGEGVLMVHRRTDLRHAPGTWSFPGGHTDPGETAKAALVRELREELGITAVVEGDPYLRIVENAEQRDGLVISLWVVRRWVGTPANTAPDENDDLRWVRSKDLDSLEVAHWSCRTVVQEFAVGAGPVSV